MAKITIEYHPVDDITTDAIGSPGERVFYIQASKADEHITLVVEKIQIQSLAVAVEQLLAEIASKNPTLNEASPHFNEAEMHLKYQPDPLFRVGNFGLGYDADEDLIILALQEVGAGENEPGEGGMARFWCSRTQIRRMIHWGIELANRGRPVCPLCGETIPPEGHFCPKNNGHKKREILNDEPDNDS